MNNLCIITLFWYYLPGQIFLLWITWWNTAASSLWICLCTKFMEPTSIISFRKSYITYLNSTECPIWLYWCFRSELLFSKSFASNVQLQLYNSRVNNTLSFQNLKCSIPEIKYTEETIYENDHNKKKFK